ncbi:MAG: acyl carrier protein [Dehalococcoidia bacterium]|nr:acyl carrier protein [Dehalococcoidia bacterium]
MNAEQARQTVFSVLRQITPEADFEELEPDVEFREQLDIDSMDFLNFIIGIHERTGIDVPEEDYPLLASLNGCVEYLGKSSAA